MIREVLQEVHRHGFIDGKEYEFVKVTQGIVPISDPRTGAKSSMGYSIEYLDANNKVVAVKYSKTRPYEFDLMPQSYEFREHGLIEGKEYEFVRIEEGRSFWDGWDRKKRQPIGGSTPGYLIRYLDVNHKVVETKFVEELPRELDILIPQRGIPRVNNGAEKPQVEHDKPIVSVTLRVMVGNNTEEVVFPGDSDIVKKINELSQTFSIISIHKTAKGYAIITTNTTGLFAGREDGIYDFDINGKYVHSARVKGMHKSTEFQSGQDKVKTKSKVNQASVIKTATNDR